MASLRLPTSREGWVKVAAVLAAVFALMFAGVRPASAEIPAGYSLTTRFEYGCGTVYNGTGLKLYYDSHGDVRTFKFEVSVTYEAGTEQTTAGHSLGNTTSYVGLWGTLPGTLESLKGEVVVVAYVDGGTADVYDEPLFERYPSADLSATYDCTPVPPSDADGDGVPDDSDQCANTPSGETVDANGCSWSQRDDDGDGVPNGTDQCPGTPPGETVNAGGCSSSQIDTDGDGVFDSVDRCPTQAGSAQNGGCPVTNPDVTYLQSGKIGKICHTAKGCKTTVVVNHLSGQTAPVLTAELSSGKLLSVKPRRENANTSVYTISFPQGVSIVSVSAVLPPGAQLH